MNWISWTLLITKVVCTLSMGGRLDASAQLGALERYADIVQCADYVVMTTRSGISSSWFTIVRIYQATAKRKHLVSTMKLGEGHDDPTDASRLSHNLGAVCIEDELHFFGGTFQNPGTREKPGILHAIGKLGAKYPGHFTLLQQPQLELEGTWPGCVEKRNHPWYLKKTCEFDGKISAVFHRHRVFIFVRANMWSRNGARHV